VTRYCFWLRWSPACAMRSRAIPRELKRRAFPPGGYHRYGGSSCAKRCLYCLHKRAPPATVALRVEARCMRLLTFHTKGSGARIGVRVWPPRPGHRGGIAC